LKEKDETLFQGGTKSVCKTCIQNRQANTIAAKRQREREGRFVKHTEGMLKALDETHQIQEQLGVNYKEATRIRIARLEEMWA
jgi:hypothetical protein